MKRLDTDPDVEHIIIHTGQHYDEDLSGVFFRGLGIRNPDFNLGVGVDGGTHYQQLAALSLSIPPLLQKLKPDCCIFLGDSNSAAVAPVVRKEGIAVAHIEAGMRSHDWRMLEEVNRVVCDHVSNVLFTYHKDYSRNLTREGVDPQKIYTVGNTVVEALRFFENDILCNVPRRSHIVLDIHRPENFLYPQRMLFIMKYAEKAQDKYGVPVKMLRFKRTFEHLPPLGKAFPFEIVDLMGYKEFLEFQHDAVFSISDSGTAQEEAPLLNLPVVVPRDFTERPQSFWSECSLPLVEDQGSWNASFAYVDGVRDGRIKPSLSWLGDGNTSELIVDALKARFSR
jgi:UDP-N-acetylglucosamine 2-epimerase (non-hydrolysing)